MLELTQHWIQRIAAGESEHDIELASMMNAVIEYGDDQDARAMYHFWSAQRHIHPQAHACLEPIMRLGDTELGRVLYQHIFHNGMLKESMPADLLHVIGYLGVDEALDRLVHYALDEQADWQQQKASCLGLLHLPLPHLDLPEPYAVRMRAALENIWGQSLFDEFLPALSCKLGMPGGAKALEQWGEQTASIDCNAGLILGIAMYGSSQQERLRRILWNPVWEADNTGTGTCVWMYLALGHVGISLTELIGDLKQALSEEQNEVTLRHQTGALYRMLNLKLDYRHQPIRWLNRNADSLTELYRLLYGWSTVHEDDSLYGLLAAHSALGSFYTDQYETLRQRMELAVQYEVNADLLASGLRKKHRR
ncbi:hypothetical protein [Paenibacillus kandeliae]|uniref:hypothetical protein n=1 Tax=Paenibacillus kandeliae TaxID=3231269 RepID=UPI003459A498